MSQELLTAKLKQAEKDDKIEAIRIRHQLASLSFREGLKIGTIIKNSKGEYVVTEKHKYPYLFPQPKVKSK